jgi:hypothetical protein
LHADLIAQKINPQLAASRLWCTGRLADGGFCLLKPRDSTIGLKLLESAATSDARLDGPEPS